jgi:hypothetical protein
MIVSDLNKNKFKINLNLGNVLVCIYCFTLFYCKYYCCNNSEI